MSQAPKPPPLPPRAPVPPPPEPMGNDPAMRLLMPVGRSGWAIAAGYLGLFALVIVPAPLALVVSLIAIRDLRKSRDSPNPRHGMGRAVFGLITGLIGTILFVIFAYAAIVAG